MSTEAADIQCANADCRVSQTRKCVEGLALDKCPHIARAAAGAQVVVTDDKVESADSTPDISLAKSERLILEDASAVMRCKQEVKKLRG